ALRHSGLCVFRDPTSAFYSPTATMRTVFPLGRIMKAAAIAYDITTTARRRARLRADARGRDGGVRQELAVGVVEAATEGGNKRNPTLLGRQDCTPVAWYPSL